MVVFTCSHCGDSIKKPAVLKHYQTVCKKYTPFLTCVDCLKDFKGDEHETHTKCFTEEERYSGKGFVPRASANKGERKQRAWSECVRGLLSTKNLQQDERKFLNSIIKYDNIPRKKVKFINFVRTAAKKYINDENLIDRVWVKLESYFEESNLTEKSQQVRTEPEKENGSTEDNKMETNESVEDGNKKKKRRKRKRKHDEAVPDASGEKPVEPESQEEEGKKKKRKKDAGEEENGQAVKGEEAKTKVDGDVGGAADDKENAGGDKKEKKKKKKEAEENENGAESVKAPADGDQSSFNWTDTIRGVLTEGDREMTLKKLQKKVMKKYCKTFGCETTDKTVKKFRKKLGKMEGVTVSEDVVTLTA